MMRSISKLFHLLKLPILYYPWSVDYAALSLDEMARPEKLRMSMRCVTFIRQKKGFVKKDIVIFLQKGFHPIVNFLS